MSRFPARALLLVFFAGVSALAGCGGSDRTPRLVERVRPAMGAELTIAAWTSNEAAALSAFESVFTELDRLEHLFSASTPGSDVVRLNETAGTRPHPVSEDTRRLLAASAEAFALSRGAFDITSGRLAGLWPVDPDQDQRIPSAKDIAASLAFVDGRLVEVERPPGTAFITRTGVRLEPGDIGRAFAVDRAVEVLGGLGLTDVLVQAGSDRFASGQHDGRPWRLGIADPRDPAGSDFASLDVSDAAFSTSRDTERSFIVDGVRYHHLIDPRTGQPARECRSVTALAPTAVTARWVSAAVFVLGPVDGLALVERLPDVEAVIVTAENRVIVSTGLRARLRIARPPGDGKP